MKRIVISLKIFIIILFITLLIYVAFIWWFSIGSSEFEVGKAFLLTLSQGDVGKAEKCLGDELKKAHFPDCPHNSAVNCALNLISKSWGNLEAIHSPIASPREKDIAILFHMFWSKLPAQPVSVVLIVKKTKSDTWRIIGWRGFIPSQGEEVDAKLLKGLVLTNQFPIP